MVSVYEIVFISILCNDKQPQARINTIKALEQNVRQMFAIWT